MKWFLILLALCALTFVPAATAANQTLTVTKAGTGSGTVTSSPAGINCGTACTTASAPFQKNSRVTLTATPASGSTFAGFSGGCVSSSNSCVVFMSANRNVTATFNGIPPPPQPACSDGLDNDSDGRADYPVDGGCATAADTSEVNLASGPEDTNGVPSGYTFCAWEGTTCSITSTKNAIYGAHGTYTVPIVKSSSFTCDNTVFGDPQPGQEKACFVADAPPPPGGRDPMFGLCNGNCADVIGTQTNSQFKYVAGGYDWITPTWNTTTIDYAEVALCYDDGYAAVGGIGTQPLPSECINNGWAQYRADGTVISVNNGANVAANPGNVGYQNFVIQKILDHFAWENAQYPGNAIDGIYFDNFAMDVCAMTTGGANSAYPVYDSNHNIIYNSDYDFQTAELSFISAVSSALHSRGYQVGTNSRGFDCPVNGNGANGAVNDDGGADKYWATRYAQYVDFAFLEEWDQWDGGTFPSGYGCDNATPGGYNGVQLSGTNAWCNEWDGWENAMEYSYSIGLNRYPTNYFVSGGGSNIPRLCRYLKGSQMLAWDGVHGGWSFTLQDYYVNGYRGCMDFDLGQPLAPRFSVFDTQCGASPNLSPCSVWRRNFVGGYVIVNPTQQSVTIGSDTIPSGDAVLHQN